MVSLLSLFESVFFTSFIEKKHACNFCIGNIQVNNIVVIKLLLYSEESHYYAVVLLIRLCNLFQEDIGISILKLCGHNSACIQ